MGKCRLDLTGWKARAQQLRSETYALYLAYRDPRTPWYAKLCAVVVVGYVFSPVDLIPDFIPLLGYLDDLVLVPLGVAWVLKMIPPEVLTESRARAKTLFQDGHPVSWAAAVVIVGSGLLVATLALMAAWRMVHGGK